MALDASLVSGAFGALNGLIGSYYSGQVSKIGLKAEQNINAMNQVTTAVVNQRNAQLTAMARWAQDVSNSRAYESVAARQEELAVNFNRARDARTRESFAQNIAFAEEEGRQQAAAAASGVTGSVVDVINMTAKLRTGMERTARMDADAQANYDIQVMERDQRQAILDNGLDWSLIFDNMQFAQTSNTTRPQTSLLGGAISGLTSQLGTSGLQTLVGGINSFFSSGSKGSDGLSGFLSLNDNFSSVKV